MRHTLVLHSKGGWPGWRTQTLLRTAEDSHVSQQSLAPALPPKIEKQTCSPGWCSPKADAASGSNEDDLSVKLSEIITVNNIIRNALEGGKALVPYVMEDWEYLQLQCAMYLNGANGAHAQGPTRGRMLSA